MVKQVNEDYPIDFFSDKSEKYKKLFNTMRDETRTLLVNGSGEKRQITQREVVEEKKITAYRAMKNEMSISEKLNLTLEEAAVYSNIGIGRLRRMTEDNDCPFVLWVGSKRLIKRKKLDEYLEKSYSI